MLRAENITHSFDYVLFENVDFEIKPKEKTAILGKSGSGKSTFLHILSTFLAPQKGKVFYKDKNIYPLSEKELINIRKNEFGIIFQFHYLFNTFSALENIQAAAILAGRDMDYALIDRLEIKEVLNQNIQTLSGGQQQRVSIARVLSKKPQIIFADEPTGNLDKANANEVMQILAEYCEEHNASLITVTHDEDLKNFFDRVYYLKNKRLEICK